MHGEDDSVVHSELLMINGDPSGVTESDGLSKP